MDGALGGHSDVAVEAPHQELADLARAPMRFVALQVNDKPAISFAVSAPHTGSNPLPSSAESAEPEFLQDRKSILSVHSDKRANLTNAIRSASGGRARCPTCHE